MKHTVEEVRLKNGARGLLIDVPNATVMSFQFQFRAGNRYVKSKAPMLGLKMSMISNQNLRKMVHITMLIPVT